MDVRPVVLGREHVKEMCGRSSLSPNPTRIGTATPHHTGLGGTLKVGGKGVTVHGKLCGNEEFVLLRFGDLQRGRAWSGTSSDRTTGNRHQFRDIFTLGPKGHDDYHPWHERIAVLGLGANAQLKPAFGWSAAGDTGVPLRTVSAAAGVSGGGRFYPATMAGLHSPRRARM
jgi:hypothetical protein